MLGSPVNGIGACIVDIQGCNAVIKRSADKLLLSKSAAFDDAAMRLIVTLGVIEESATAASTITDNGCSSYLSYKLFTKNSANDLVAFPQSDMNISAL